MKKVLSILVLVMVLAAAVPSQALAVNTARHGEISGRSFVYGLTSLLIWPGIGQYLHKNETKKNLTHALIGLFPPFRLWSGWDAMISRTGGRWDGKI